MRAYAKKRTRHAFTLIELLVVMAVIAILLGLLVPTLGAIRKQVNIVRTEAIITGIAMALDQYKVVQYRYPPDKATEITASPGQLNKSSECLVYYLSGGSIAWKTLTEPPNYPWQNTIFRDPSGDGTLRKAMFTYYPFKDRMLVDSDADKIPELIDPWGGRIIYNAGSTGTSYNQRSAPVHNINKYDLLSAGPDRKLDTTADNVKNWDDQLTDDYATTLQ
jgi:prepilin-type N-terminal cleavage/methylation domain-containing protein